MDPYLEDPAIWSGVHAAILGAIFERLGPAVRPKYAVRYEERVYVTSEDDPGYRAIVPDLRVIERSGSAPGPQAGSHLTIEEPVPVMQLEQEEVHERSLHIIDVRDHRVVSVIELLSPSNKVLHSAGRASFVQKRREVLASDAHWMEIDLLRAGARTALSGVSPSHYQVYLSRAGDPRRGFAWPISIRQRMPIIGIPLLGDDPDVPLDLQAVLATVIERGSYDLDFDYLRPPVPPLPEEDARWSQESLRLMT
jgi:hypothetical protein